MGRGSLRRVLATALLAVTMVGAGSAHAGAALGPANRENSDLVPVLRARVVPSSTTTSPPAQPPAEPGDHVQRVEWIPDPNGPRLAVFPTDYGRYRAPASDWPAAWDEVVRLEPTADQRHMRDQFRCHVEFARISEPEKPSWNLEQWRPDVGYLATVLARCNPE